MDQLQEKILEALTAGPIDTLQVSKKVFGNIGTQKMVNPALYNLLKMGRVEKITTEGTARPQWKLANI